MTTQAKITDLFREASNSNGTAQNGESSGKSNKMSIEKIYQKKSQLEHILLRPDTYIGSVEKLTEKMWVYDNEKQQMALREITFVPGLYKIFDEILVNAADNKQRDPSMDTIDIHIDAESNVISVKNNGKGIPVVQHKEEKMFVPTLIFGHLLTSSNYNDDEAKVTGGRNGYGAKLCNIFSTKFTVETACSESKKNFKQTWANNMSKTTEPKVTAFSGKDYTKVTFSPDLVKFKMDRLDKDTVDLLSRRAYDVAGASWGVKVILNGKRIPVKGFKDYCEQYIKEKAEDSGNPVKIIYEKFSPRWEVACCVSDQGFQQVSFVNSIATTKGGRHVDYICDQLTKSVVEVVNKKNKNGVTVKPFQVKNHLFLFVNCLIVNPTFDSQTKENMTLQVKSFGSSCKLSEKFINAVQKSGVVSSVMTWALFKAQTQLNAKTGSRKQSTIKGVPKLEDANWAGTKDSAKCSLILTEGDSAKALAVSGLSVVGRNQFGVFPLRGKLLNVREASHKQIMENAEINNLVKILGLQYKRQYASREDMTTLRYGKVMIMTDQDQDGSHIKGLLINFIHHNWPSLLKMGFIEEFITPIVKAKYHSQQFSFYSIPEFEEWKRATPNWVKYTIKYYKGLGTSTSAEAKEYFTNMLRHRIQFEYKGSSDDNSIVMAFSKKAVDQRKEWLTTQMAERKRRRELELPEVYLYEKDTKAVSFTDFVNKELVLFSNADNERSIPSMVDGLKPGQRKVLFTCFKRKDKREVKVAQLAGSVAELSAYHHGEQSLMGTMINLAQDFVGSNNINLLQPIGQFGTRATGGKDAASPRYIFTKLSPLAKHLFNPDDEKILNYLKDDNQSIEPEWYIPILPMVLVNGASGIGTGWMTNVPNYNPREIVDNLLSMIDGGEPKQMHPWFRNFRGVISQIDAQHYWHAGEIAELRPGKVEITELPIRKWTQDYREGVLDPMLNGSEKTAAVLSDVFTYHTDTTVRFVVEMPDAKYREAENKGLHKYFKLISTFSLTSMVLFDQNGVIKKYESAEEILREFFDLRLSYYDKRKAFLVGMLQAEAGKLTNQARFICEKCDGDLVVENKRRKAMVKELADRGYDSDPVLAWRRKYDKDAVEREIVDGAGSDEEGEESSVEEGGRNYDYLLEMRISSLTLERKQKLLEERDKKQEDLRRLVSTTPKDMWRRDLREFSAAYDKMEEDEKKKERLEMEKAAKAGNKDIKGRKAPRLSAREFLPADDAMRIDPKPDPELISKFDAEKKTRNTVKTENAGEEGGTSPEKPKPKPRAKKEKLEGSDEKSPAKKPRGRAAGSGGAKNDKKKKKRLSWVSDSDEEMGSDASDASFESPPPKPAAERGPRRAAAQKKVSYSLSEAENSDGDASDEFIDNLGAKEDNEPKVSQSLLVDSDEEEEERRAPPPRSPPKNTSDDELFDSLLNVKPLAERLAAARSNNPPAAEISAEPSAPKAPPKKRVLASKPTSAFGGSDSEDEGPSKPKKPAPAKKPKRMLDSDSDAIISSDEEKKTKAKRAQDSDSDVVISSDEDKKKKKKPAAKKPSVKKSPVAKKPKGKGKKKKGSDSESEGGFSGVEDVDDDFRVAMAVSRDRPGRAKVPVKYSYDDSDSD
ncbi:unnamed protein product [Notodromas monacha]|uniref:DNA topoisomerase 2 n=1 Tax=Notodromas monacha TaxID=399045 RepID=A0A7R9BL27_9CRUS|nr:unnamed protein product [Notodromas monacha]CAG0917454.1 unnamed protein product [Notodromas monacha]